MNSFWAWGLINHSRWLRRASFTSARAEMEARYGLDRPLPVQYGIWLGKVLRGDLGTAIVAHRTVRWTLAMGGFAFGLFTMFWTALTFLLSGPPFDYPVSIIGLFGCAAAWTGASEKTLKRLGDDDYEKTYLYPNSHAGYYPGATPLPMKVLFRKSDGRLLGAQAVGMDGVDKRISALAMAIQMGATIYDLEEAELCYAPQFGSAKDPVNFAGMVAADILRGDMPVAHWDALGDGLLLDVREMFELAVESVPGAIHIPLAQLRSRLNELPRDREICVICRSGGRAYYATRVLLQNGFCARTIAGGMLSRYHSHLLPD